MKRFINRLIAKIFVRTMCRLAARSAWAQTQDPQTLKQDKQAYIAACVRIVNKNLPYMLMPVVSQCGHRIIEVSRRDWLYHGEGGEPVIIDMEELPYWIASAEEFSAPMETTNHQG